MPLDARHLVDRAMRGGFAAMEVPTPGVRLSCANGIPHGRGLGLVVRRHRRRHGGRPCSRGRRGGRVGRRGCFALAADIEGHPDNVAPGAAGRLHDRGRTARRSGPAVPGRLLVLGGGVRRRTAYKPRWREGCCRRGPHADAAANAVGRLCWSRARRTSRAAVAATEDFLHQQQRQPAMPESLELWPSCAGAAFRPSSPGQVRRCSPSSPTTPRRWRTRSRRMAGDPQGSVAAVPPC